MVKGFGITVASGEEGGLAGKRNEGAFWHNGNVLFLDRGDGYIYRDSSNCILNTYAFYSM